MRNTLGMASPRCRMALPLATAAGGAVTRPWGTRPDVTRRLGIQLARLTEASELNSLTRNRQSAASLQGYRCYYCGLPMWLDDPARFAALHGLSMRQARLLRCTAEHLRARSDAGRDHRQNIVAACLFCNQHRHRARTPLGPEELRERVALAMQRRRWIAGNLPESFVRGNFGGWRMPNKRIERTP
jgi:hypothetical protein